MSRHRRASSFRLRTCWFIAILCLCCITYVTLRLLNSVSPLAMTDDVDNVFDLMTEALHNTSQDVLHVVAPLPMSDLSALYDNPFKQDKCRFALQTKYDMVDPQGLSNQSSWCRQFSGVATRENWNRLQRVSHMCPSRQRSAIRSHELKISEAVYKETVAHNLSWLVDIAPVYFMVAKSGSSSITSYLNEYNHHFGYDKYGGIAHSVAVAQRVTTIQSECSFTFVRDPMTRFISAYYTINALLWVTLKERFMNIDNQTFLKWELPFGDRKRHLAVKFASVKGEPKRLHAFIRELKNNPYAFTRLWSFDHVQSQSEILSVYLGRLKSALHFVGKQERMQQHWTELVSLCHHFFHNNSEIMFSDKKKKKRKIQVEGYGWKAPQSWHADYERYKDYVEFMGLRKVYDYYVENKDDKGNVDMNAILPPVWYHVDEALYNEIAEYYHQDYECFGYVPSYQQFAAKRAQYVNIYQTEPP